MAAILLAGIVSFMQLPVSALPEVDYPIIQVVTFYPGASPDVMASAVTAPLERQFGQVPGLNQMTSTSSDGSSVIVLQFSLDLNIDVAEQEVQASINAAQSYLPADLPVPPIYSKTNPADAPVLTLGITSKTLPLSQVEDLVDTRLAPKISQLNGVGLVSISGGQKPAVRIQANPVALASYGIDLESLRTALRDVITRCIYGVDLNPMAVELCKVALWMEAVDPGLPLTFLDAHIQQGIGPSAWACKFHDRGDTVDLASYERHRPSRGMVRGDIDAQNEVAGANSVAHSFHPSHRGKIGP